MQPPTLRIPLAESEPYDATDPEQEKKARTTVELRESRLRQVEAAILSTPQGREWVWSLLTGDCHLFDSKIAISGAYEQGLLNGQQAVGNGLMRRLIRANPQNFALMYTELDK
jgi:hypothetical protein